MNTLSILFSRPRPMLYRSFTMLCLLALLPRLHAQTDPGGQFRIATTPPDASVTLNGESVGQTPLDLSDVRVGENFLVISKPGYATLRRTLNVVPNQREALDFTLDEITALLVIDSIPQGADVFIRDASRGRTPVLITDLPLGNYRVRLTKTGYVEKEVELKLDSRVPVKKQIELTSNAATLELESKPTGARVVLNGADRGTTPITLDRIPSGKVTLEMTETGYQPYKQEMVLDVGQKETIRAVLVPIAGELSVVSIPAGARIYIDSQFRGTAPVAFKEFAAGTYSIKAEKRGFADLTRTVTVPRAASVVEEFRLNQISGMIELTTEPAGVSVFLDGNPVGTTESGTNETDRVSAPLLLEFVEEGEHSLQLTRKGFFGKELEFIIERNQTLTMHHNLERRFIPNYEVITAKGVVKGVFHEIDADGAVRMEISPGVIKTVPAAEIRVRRALRGENIPTPEETQILSTP